MESKQGTGPLGPPGVRCWAGRGARELDDPEVVLPRERLILEVVERAPDERPRQVNTRRTADRNDRARELLSRENAPAVRQRQAGGQRREGIGAGVLMRRVERDAADKCGPVGRLRKKIERDPEHPTMLHSVQGVGYRFDADPGNAVDART